MSKYIINFKIFEQLSEELKNWDMKEVHISKIRGGDTVLHNGEIKTVSHNNIKHNTFMGSSLFGDSYNGGSKLVKRLTPKKPN